MFHATAAKCAASEVFYSKDSRKVKRRRLEAFEAVVARTRLGR
jgi:hypothetical protein